MTDRGHLVEGQETPQTARWTDSHCHLQDDADPGATLARARAAGVARVVVAGTDVDQSRRALALARTFRGAPGGPDVLATVGLHPHEARHGVDGVVALVEEVLANGTPQERGGGPPLVAVGECGLDYHYDHSPRRAQRDAFGAQVALARRLGLALVVHTREAWDDTLAILDEVGTPERTVVHCFSGGPDEAQALLDRGAYLSFSGIVTFPSAAGVREAASFCPEDRLLVETDSPFLTPVPYRGRANEPAFVPLVGAVLARLRDVPAEAIAEASSENAARVFAVPGLDAR